VFCAHATSIRELEIGSAFMPFRFFLRAHDLSPGAISLQDMITKGVQGRGNGHRTEPELGLEPELLDAIFGP
jgi:hypothetical protein